MKRNFMGDRATRFGMFLTVCVLTRPSNLTHGAEVILNEYNAVSSDRWLDCDEGPPTCDAADTFFGRVQGNGGNWFELVVIQDHLDMRGWQLEWTEDPADVGTLTLSSALLWSDLRSGTIITFTESTTAEGGLDTDTSYDPTGGDWWVSVNSFDGQYVTTTTNVPGDGPGNFSVGNDNWQLTIKNDIGAVIFGPAGEGIPASDPGVNSREVFKLEQDPSDSIDPLASNYQDGTSSSFGSQNIWSGGTVTQNFSALRDILPTAWIELVTLASPSPSETLATLPILEREFAPGDTFVVEMWAQTLAPDGLSMVGADIAFDQLLVSALSISHSSLFDQWPSGTIDNVTGIIDDVSGSHLPSGVGCSDQVGVSEWVRVAMIEMSADGIGTLRIQTGETASPYFYLWDCGGWWPDDVPNVNFGGVDVTIAEEVSIALVTLPSPSMADELPLPAAQEEFAEGETVYVEMWAQTSDPKGLSMVSADIAFDASLASATTITHTDLFSLYPSGAIDNVGGLVENLSGAVLPVEPACSTHVGASLWARVAIVEMTPFASGSLTMQSADAGSPVYVVATCGPTLPNAPPPNVTYGGAKVVISGCLVATAPQPDVIRGKNRYLSFRAGDPGQTQAIRVTFASLPDLYGDWVNTRMWVQTPVEVCNKGGVLSPTVAASCDTGVCPSGICRATGFCDGGGMDGQPCGPKETIWAATLGCTPAYLDWTAYNVVHIHHEGIIPSRNGGTQARYEIELIDASCSLSEDNFSPALNIVNPIHGDVSGAFVQGLGENSYTEPDTVVDIAPDFTAVVDAFRGTSTAPIKPRADVEFLNVDQLINITDAINIVDAFRGLDYPYIPSGPAPCP